MLNSLPVLLTASLQAHKSRRRVPLPTHLSSFAFPSPSKWKGLGQIDGCKTRGWGWLRWLELVSGVCGGSWSWWQELGLVGRAGANERSWWMEKARGSDWTWLSAGGRCWSWWGCKKGQGLAEGAGAGESWSGDRHAEQRGLGKGKIGLRGGGGHGSPPKEGGGGG